MNDTDCQSRVISAPQDGTLITAQAFYTLRCQSAFFFLKWRRRGQRIGDLEHNVSELNQKMAGLQNDVNRKNKEIALLKLRLYGKSSEKHKALQSDSSEVDNDHQDFITIESHTREKKKNKKSCGRQVDTSILPRYTEVIDLSPEEKNCSSCHQEMAFFDEVCSETIECLPELMYVHEVKCLKYVCRNHGCNQLAVAAKPLAPIPKAMAGINLLTEVLLRKYRHHMPLYRKSQMFTTHHVDIPDNTLGNWVMTLGKALMPLMGASWQEMILSGYLQADETPIQLLSQNKKGYIWAYYSPEKRLIYFEVADSRSGKVAESRLQNFKGLLQTDGYRGYEELRNKSTITPFSCLTHARRKFKEIVKSTGNTTGIAAQAVVYLKPLYEIETYAREQANLVLPKSPIGKAIAYLLKV